MTRTRPRVRVVVLAMVVLGACQPASPEASSGPSGNPSASPSAASSASPSGSMPAAAGEPMLEVLNFLTLDTRTISLTDWDGMKAAYGADDLTSADPHEERMAFMLQTATASATDAPFACFGCRGYAVDALKTHWGFDNLDLAWEADIFQQRARVVVLRFPDDADLTSLISRFDERGYSNELRDGVTIRVHAQEFAEWWTSTDAAILNAAFLPDGHTVLLATSVPGLESVLSRDPALPALRSARVFGETVRALERPTAAFLAFDLNELCNPFLRMSPNEELQATVESLLDRAGPLRPYTLMAVGNRGSLTPAGRIVFGYGDPAEAAADLAGRRLLADEGVAILAGGHPLRETFFALVDARTDDGTIVLSVGPPMPTTPLPSGVTSLGTALFLPRLAFDNIFAACDLSPRP